jgi:transposase-like protein
MTPLSETDAAIARRVGELARETLREWWRRFAKERGMAPFTEKEIAELIELGKADEMAGHQ